MIAVGAAVGAVAVGGLAWAAWSFFSTGAQPAEALPDSTLAYASIDLDPSGGQKIEALRTLQKFPAFKDQVGIDSDDDIREWIFDADPGRAPTATASTTATTSSRGSVTGSRWPPSTPATSRLPSSWSRCPTPTPPTAG